MRQNWCTVEHGEVGLCWWEEQWSGVNYTVVCIYGVEGVIWVINDGKDNRKNAMLRNSYPLHCASFYSTIPCGMALILNLLRIMWQFLDSNPYHLWTGFGVPEVVTMSMLYYFTLRMTFASRSSPSWSWLQVACGVLWHSKIHLIKSYTRLQTKILLKCRGTII